jgi:hypothetical protein
MREGAFSGGVRIAELMAIPARAEERAPSQSLSAWIEMQMSEWRIPGASIAVYQIEWTASFGFSDKDNNI